MSNENTNKTNAPILYKREDDYIPRVAAIHDLCGYVNCSLGVAIPVPVILSLSLLQKRA